PTHRQNTRYAVALALRQGSELAEIVPFERLCADFGFKGETVDKDTRHALGHGDNMVREPDDLRLDHAL
ncbi:hypothetical protein, partial [Stenotrophomonas maltophilia]|uniref:hypothetical protein n=1 Tax=Stenotrophomonas maltophilia TaxID=40324 RepID=UPI001953A675